MDNFINAVKSSIANKNWYSALTLALTLPDIAGKIDNPTMTSGKRYALWFNDNMLDKYKFQIGPDREDHVFLSGNDCYALRCAFLHEGMSEILAQSAREIIEDFQFVAPPQDGIIHCNKLNNKLQLQVDIFCKDIIESIENWIKSISTDKAKTEKLTKFLKIFEIK